MIEWAVFYQIFFAKSKWKTRNYRIFTWMSRSIIF